MSVFAFFGWSFAFLFAGLAWNWWDGYRRTSEMLDEALEGWRQTEDLLKQALDDWQAEREQRDGVA